MYIEVFYDIVLHGLISTRSDTWSGRLACKGKHQLLVGLSVERMESPSS